MLAIGVVTLLFVIKVVGVEQNNTKTLSSISADKIANAVDEKIIADGDKTREAIDTAVKSVNGSIGTLNETVGAVNKNVTDSIKATNENIEKVGTIVADDGKTTRDEIKSIASRLDEISKKLVTPPPPAPATEPAPAVQAAPATQTPPPVAPSVQAVTPSPQATPTSNGNGVTVVQNTHERKMSRSGQWTVTTFEKGTVSDYYSEEQFTEKCVGLGSESGVHAKLFYKKNWVSEPWTKDVEVTPGVPFDIHGAYRVVFFSETTDFNVWTKPFPQSQ